MQELEKILEEIGGLRGQAGSECTSEDHYIKKAWEHCLDRVVDIIRRHMNDGWIPVEERLPEVTEEDIIPVEVTTMGGLRTVGWYFEYMNEWYALDGDSKLNVIAWEEPSEPYQPERRIQNNDVLR